MYRQHKFAAALIATGLSGCGLSVPEISELWDQDRPADPVHKTPTLTATAQIEFEIKQKVYCELSYAIEEVQKLRIDDKPPIPDGWGVQMQLSLEVDESVSLSPGATFTQLLPSVMKIFGVFPNNTLNSVPVAQSFSLGFGGTLSSDAHRIDKFNTYYSINDLRQKAPLHCQTDGKPYPQKDYFLKVGWTPAESSPLLIQSDLGLKDWLVGATFFDSVLPSTSPQPSASSTPSNSGGHSQAPSILPRAHSQELLRVASHLRVAASHLRVAASPLRVAAEIAHSSKIHFPKKSSLLSFPAAA